MLPVFFNVVKSSLCPVLQAYSPMLDAGDCKRPTGKDPSRWGVEDVVWFIKDADPQALGPHAETFRKHVSSVLSDTLSDI